MALMSLARLACWLRLGSRSGCGDLLLNSLQAVIDVAEVPNKEEVAAARAKGDTDEDHEGDRSPALIADLFAHLLHNDPRMIGLAAQLRDRPFDSIGDRTAEVVLARRFDASRDVLTGLLAQHRREL